jgi:hypothetical protein
MELLDLLFVFIQVILVLVWFLWITSEKKGVKKDDAR